MNIKTIIIYRKIKKFVSLFIILILLFIIIQTTYLYDNIIKVKSIYDKQIEFISKDICSRLTINGIEYSNYNNIQKYINDYCNIKGITLQELRNNILKDYWVKDVFIKKTLPNRLTINIIEHNPFAILTEDGKDYNLIDEFGETINIPQDEIINFSHLLIIIGKNLKNDINNIFNILSIYNNITTKLVKIERIENRRWNLLLKNDILVKMPEEDRSIIDTWDNLEKIINIPGLTNGLEEIDLRIKGKIYLKYNDSVIQEIKNISM